MSVLKLSEISDRELATRLLTTTGRLEPHCEELAKRLLAWCDEYECEPEWWEEPHAGEA